MNRKKQMVLKQNKRQKQHNTQKKQKEGIQIQRKQEKLKNLRRSKIRDHDEQENQETRMMETDGNEGI